MYRPYFDRNQIMDRTLRPLDPEVARRTLHDAGYSFQVFHDIVSRSYGIQDPEQGHAYTHARTSPNDHYWCLYCCQGVWYFRYTDYSPRQEAAHGDQEA